MAPGSMVWIKWRSTLHVVDLMCCCSILFPIVWSIRHLRQVCCSIPDLCAYGTVQWVSVRFSRSSVMPKRTTHPSLEGKNSHLSDCLCVVLYRNIGLNFSTSCASSKRARCHVFPCCACVPHLASGVYSWDGPNRYVRFVLTVLEQMNKPTSFFVALLEKVVFAMFQPCIV